MGGQSAPKPPSPQVTAAAQTGSDIGKSIANAWLTPSQVTPFGSMTQEKTGVKNWRDPSSGKVYKIPQFTQKTTLNPAEQAIYNSNAAARGGVAATAQQKAGQLGSLLGKPLNAPNLGEVGAGPNLATSYKGADDFSKDRGRVEAALMSRMNPSLEQERGRMTAQLANQGIKQGTEAYDRAVANWGQQSNDANMQAILAGGQEQSRLTGLSRDAAAFGNDSRQQMFANNLTRTGFNNDTRSNEFGMGQAARSGGINELMALLNGGQVQQGGFSPMQGGQMPNTDMGALIGQQYQGQMDAWKQQQQGRGQLMGGLFSAGTAMLPLMLSDKRTKENIEPVGAEFAGNPVYEYNYKHDPSTRHIGVMAQDVKKTHPEAVVPMGKFLGVNYGKLAARA